VTLAGIAARKISGFVVTMDRGIEHQQNVQQLTLGIIVLRAPSKP
jgi:hypothetical protein